MQADLTTGYGTYNTLSANNFFFVNDDEYRISPDGRKKEVCMEKDPNIVRNASKSIVEVYSGGKRISKSEYDSPASAWLAAYNTADYKKKTILTFGGDWVIDKMLQLDKNKRITLDLNGHFINRNLDHEMKDAGGLFRLDGKSLLTIRDSNPDSVGFDGIKGGVLTGGASSDTGGCFEIVGSSKVILEGGAIFVDCRYWLTVRGLMTIKDNECPKRSMANLTLEYGAFTDGKIINSGLYRGSVIRIGTTHDSGETELTQKDSQFNEYQMRYFEADEGRLQFKKIGNQFIGMATSASIFGNGSVAAVICIGAFWIILAVVVITVKKTRDKKAAAVTAAETITDDEKAGKGGAENDKN